MAKTLKIGFFVSVFLNILIIGMVIGAMMRFNDRPARPNMPATEIGVIMRALPEEERKIMGNNIRKAVSSRPMLLIAPLPLPDILEQDPPQVEAIEAALNQNLERNSENGRVMNREIANHLAGLPLAMRQDIAQSLREAPPPPSIRPYDKHDDDDHEDDHDDD